MTGEAAPVSPSGYAAIRAVLRIRPFRRLWLVLSAASFGDWLGLLATSIFAASLVEGSTAQGAAFGGTIAIRLLPALLLGPVAGVLADRFDRRHAMVICDLLRFVLFASIPMVAIFGASGAVAVAWAAIATFLIETITMIWIPAKEAAVPNLIPRSRLETANQLSLITTYGITPIAAAGGLAILTVVVDTLSGPTPSTWANPAMLALFLNALSRLATALVVWFGIKEISGRVVRGDQQEQSMVRLFVDGWRFIGRTPLVRGLVLGIFGAFAAGGVVVGVAKFFALSLGAGEAAFYMLFGAVFLGLAIGVGVGPALVRELSRRRWFGMSIVLAAASVMGLSAAPHLALAIFGAILVGAGAGMAFLAGTTLLGGEVADDVRGRVFAVVQIGARLVLMLAISLSSLLVGIGGSRELRIADLGISVSSTRLLLLVAGAAGIVAGISAFRQMDDKPGVPVLADLWGSMRGRPLAAAEPFASAGLFVVFEGGVGAGKSTHVQALADALRQDGREVVITGDPGAVPETEAEGILSEVAPAPVTPRADVLLHAARRAQHVATVVRPALRRGAVVLSDCYVDSSLAYEQAARRLPVDQLSWLSAWATGGLKPDLVVLLDVNPAVALARLSPERADEVEESPEFAERLRFAYLDLAAEDPARYLVLDAARPAEETFGSILARIEPMVRDPASVVRPEPARQPDVSVEPELSDAELIGAANGEPERRP